MTSRGDASHAAMPGKRSLTEALPPIQAKAEAQRAAAGVAGATAPSAGAGGKAMPEDVQHRMESAIGADFSAVRIHEGSQSQAIGARAYTQGTDIHFAPGEYQPASPAGQELLGHELAHVVQQRQGRVPATTQAKGVAVNDDAGLEHEADRDRGPRGPRRVRRRRYVRRPGVRRPRVGWSASGGSGVVQRKIGSGDNVIRAARIARFVAMLAKRERLHPVLPGQRKRRVSPARRPTRSA